MTVCRCPPVVPVDFEFTRGHCMRAPYLGGRPSGLRSREAKYGTDKISGGRRAQEGIAHSDHIDNKPTGRIRPGRKTGTTRAGIQHPLARRVLALVVPGRQMASARRQSSEISRDGPRGPRQDANRAPSSNVPGGPRRPEPVAARQREQSAQHESGTSARPTANGQSARQPAAGPAGQPARSGDSSQRSSSGGNRPGNQGARPGGFSGGRPVDALAVAGTGAMVHAHMAPTGPDISRKVAARDAARCARGRCRRDWGRGRQGCRPARCMR